MSSPVILAIETSQHEGSVALRDCGGVVHVEKLSPQKRHDDDLLPAIDRAFARAGLRPEDLRGGIVAVSIGPGGFTGLRIAVSSAKMFADVLAARIVAVPTALVAAESFASAGEGEEGRPGGPRGPAGPIICALASKNETAWCTRLEQIGPTKIWTVMGDAGVIAASALDLSNIKALLADEHLPQSFRARCEGAGVPVIDPSFEAANCLAVAERLAAGGGFTDPLALLPLYPRPPEAVTLWERRVQKRSDVRGQRWSETIRNHTAEDSGPSAL